MDNRMTSFHQPERALAFLAVILALTCAHAAPAQKTGDQASNTISAGMRDVATAGVNAGQALEKYRADLAAFRREFGGSRAMPAVPFFQFGMGPRPKLIFKDGVLRDAAQGTVLREWKTSNALIVPPDYLVSFTTPAGGQVRIVEDEQAVWIEENGQKTAVEGTRQAIKLPTFAGHRYASVLRVLHHEILINVVNGLPVPNFHVYRTPWYRDGAMMAMCLQKTGNLEVIGDWIRGLAEVFDRNNAGETEADNPGQALFLLSLVSDKNHSLVPKILEALKRFEVKGEAGVYVKGRSDFADHPVYQTKWAKFGLRALGLPDPYVIPVVPDSYSSLFWMDYRDRHVVGVEAADRGFYPYLGWATDHFQRVKKSPISDQDYPLSWEIQASQADYRGMAAIDPVFVKQKTSVPHTWHAAEVFLYLLDEPDRSSPAATKDGASAGSMFTNPVAARGADPWVVLWKNNYYFCQSGGPSVWVSRSSHLQDIGQGQRQRVWIPPPGTAYSKELWAPELHHLRGKWWIYVAADDGDNAHHRIVSVNLPGPAAMCSIRSHG